MTRLRERVLRSGEMEVVILPEVGGRIHRFRAFGRDLLRTPNDVSAHVSDGFFWGAYVMAPWCNRITAGPAVAAGRAVELAPNFPDGTAIHGLVSSAPWVEVADDALAYRDTGRRGWPWAFELHQRVALAGAMLDLEYRLLNLDPEQPMPAGLGLHPWFVRPLEVRIPAERVYARNAGSPPQPAAVAGAFDLRSGAPPAGGLDATWTGLTEPRIELAWPEFGIGLTIEIEIDTGAALVALANPPTLDAVAVEPQTHAPDALRRLAAGEPDAPALLPPGGSMRLALRLTVERIPKPS